MRPARSVQPGTRVSSWFPTYGRGSTVSVISAPAGSTGGGGVNPLSQNLAVVTGDIIVMFGQWTSGGVSRAVTLSTSGPSVTSIYADAQNTTGGATLGYAIATSTTTLTCTATLNSAGSGSRISFIPLVLRGVAASPVDNNDIGSGSLSAGTTWTVPGFTPVQVAPFVVFAAWSGSTSTLTGPASPWASTVVSNTHCGILGWWQVPGSRVGTGDYVVSSSASVAPSYARFALQRAA